MPLPRKGDLIAGRYEIGEILGIGGMGRVYLARDLRQNHEVAFKVLSAEAGGDPAHLARFEREILTLRKLDHPDILRYLDHGTNANGLFLVTELLRGRSLSEAAPDFRAQPEKVLLLGARLARAFAAAHRKGVVHRDIKPGNLFLMETGEPRILDYGLARWELPDGASPESATTIEPLTRAPALMGTIPYMSPEQLRCEAVDRRTDIFSLAVVLYEAVAGRRPYVGGTTEELIRAMEEGSPRRLREIEPRLGEPAGEALDQVLHGALRPLPHERFHSMDELARALDLARDLDTAIPKDASTAILLPPRPTLAERELRALVGRDRELALLERALSEARAGQGAAILVEGPAGIGKSMLVNEVLRSAHGSGFLCLPGTVPSPGAETGEHPARAWLRRALEVFPADTDARDALHSLQRQGGQPAGDDPVLSAPAAAAMALHVEPRERQERLSAAIAALASRMPIVLLVEDLHFATPALLSLLDGIARTANARRLLLLGTMRSDAVPIPESETEMERFLAAPRLERLALGQLSAPDIQAIAAEVYAGLALGGQFLEHLVARSGGSPHYALAILRHLEEQGVLKRDGAGWIAQESALPATPPEAQIALEARLAGLGAAELAAIEGAAVLGQQFQPARLAELLDLDQGEAEGLVRVLDRKRRLIVRGEGGYSFDQPLTRDLVLQRVSRERARDLNLKAAVTLAQRTGGTEDVGICAAVASYFLRAGAPDEALPHAIRTGVLHQHAGAHEEALPWLDRSRALLEGQIETVQGPAREPLRPRLAEIELALGESLHAVARQGEAIDHLEKARALGIAGRREDLHARSLTAMSHAFLARGDTLQAQRKAKEAGKVARRASLELELAQALAAEAYALSRSGEIEGAEERWAEAAAILDALGRSEEAAEVHFRLGNHLFRLDRYDRAEECYAAAAARADQSQDSNFYAKILNARAGIILLARERPAEALPMFEEAAAIRRRLGLRREEVTSLHNIAYCHHLLGDLEKARELYAQVVSTRREIGEAARRADSQRNHAEVLLQLGRIEDAMAEAAEAIATKRQMEDLGYLPHCLNLLGEIELELGRTERAREAFEEVLRDYPSHVEESLRARDGLASTERMAGQDESAALLVEELLARITSDPHRLVSLPVLLHALSFLRSRGSDPAHLRSIAAPFLDARDERPLPELEITLGMIRATLAICEGNDAEARSWLRQALEVSRKVGLVERVWRLERDLALLEPEGSAARAAGLRAAIAIIEAQAGRIAQEELRSAYLAHRERADLLGGTRFAR